MRRLEFKSNIKELLENRAKQFKKKTQSKKIDFEFQQIGIEMQGYFKRNLWYVFTREPLDNIKKAFQICKEKNKDYKYFFGILKNL